MTDNVVKPGQVWIDNDPRCRGRRRLKVEYIVGDDEGRSVAVCKVLTDYWGKPVPSYRKPVRIRVDRMKPTSTGYRLDTTGGTA